MTSPTHHFDVVLNDPAPENECISECINSAVAAINYMEYQNLAFFIHWLKGSKNYHILTRLVKYN